MELFDIVKNVFNKKGWEKVTSLDKSRNFFMINRIMSIQFPIQANQFNRSKINPIPVIDWWHEAMSGYFKAVPSWIYTKTKKGEKKVKEENFEDAERFVCERLMISRRELSDLKNFFPDKYSQWISSVDSQIKGNDHAK
jgi:hypothetical protein